MSVAFRQPGKPRACRRFLSSLPVLLAAFPLRALSEPVTLETIVITAPQALESSESSLGATPLDAGDIAPHRTATSDSARLLQDLPGVSLYGAGGISSLPAIRGLADDRVRTQVDGMDLVSACPNHMNSPLSYIDPTKVAKVTVFAGIAPVSVGGDSLGGTIQMESAPPEFTRPGEDAHAKGHAGTFYRSNSNARGYNLGATLVDQRANLSYSESRSQADNYTAGDDFKPVAPGRENGPPIPGDEVASSAYDGALNREIGLALRQAGHLLQLNASKQLVDFEGFPNQRMDMTDNDNTLLNLRYTGQYGWGDLKVNAYHQDTRHQMDMGPDRYSYGTGMPMYTKAETGGALVQGNLLLSDRDTLRVGVEYQEYTLYDWWPPVGGTMGPNAFWNIDYGRRDKLDAFGEWEAQWNTAWTTLIGVRSDNVMTDAAPVQGYDNGLAALWGDDAAAFNALDRKHTDHNWDLTVLGRYTQDTLQTYELGYARKSRSPNLYQRYAWSTNPMAALMNNFVGDGNGYLGNAGLQPEIANTVSLTGDWHAADATRWRVKATGYYTRIQDYIDARRCDFGQCSADNATATTGFVLLQYVNQSARLYGLDLSADMALGQSERYGSFTGALTLNYVRGDNRSSGDDLYNIMPPNATARVTQRLAGWTNTAEVRLVAAKSRVSGVRNEIPTDGYGLLNLRSGYEWKRIRLDIGIENVFDRFYSMPLGGAYVGQGPSMTTNGIPWGVPVPGMGRSFNLALNIQI